MSCCTLPQQYSPTAASRELLALVAVGPKNIPSGFFNSFDSTSSPMTSLPTVSTVVDVVEAAAQEGVVELNVDALEVLEVQHASECDVSDGDNLAVMEETSATSSFASVREEFLETLNHVLDQFGDSSTSLALQKASSRLRGIRNSNTLNSFLFTLGSSLGVKGGKIPCQPSSVSRRSDGLSRGRGTVGKGRRPKELPVQKAKRKRNLAENVRANQANAKSH